MSANAWSGVVVFVTVIVVHVICAALGYIEWNGSLLLDLPMVAAPTVLLSIGLGVFLTKNLRAREAKWDAAISKAVEEIQAKTDDSSNELIRNLKSIRITK